MPTKLDEGPDPRDERIAALEVEMGSYDVARDQVRSAIADYKCGAINAAEMVAAIETALRDW